MTTHNQKIDGAIQRFLENIQGSNAKLLYRIIQKAEKKKNAAYGGLFSWFSCKPNKILTRLNRLSKSGRLDSKALSDALDDYLADAGSIARTAFVKEILAHYDLKQEIIDSVDIYQTVNYLRKQNFIMNFKRHYPLFELKGPSV